MKPFEVELVAGKADHVLGLSPREAELDELRLVGSGNPRPGREGIGLAGLDAEPLDEAATDRGRRDQATPAAP